MRRGEEAGWGKEKRGTGRVKPGRKGGGGKEVVIIGMEISLSC